MYWLAARPDVLAETVSRDLWQRKTEPIHQVVLKALLCICHRYQVVTAAEKHVLLCAPSQHRATRGRSTTDAKSNQFEASFKKTNCVVSVRQTRKQVIVKKNI